MLSLGGRIFIEKKKGEKDSEIEGSIPSSPMSCRAQREKKCYFSFSFTVLSLLMLLQYPMDDKSCLYHYNQQSCESVYKYWVSVHTLCEWTPGEGLNYCAHREISSYDDRVLIMGALLTALACAPLTFFIEYYFRFS